MSRILVGHQPLSVMISPIFSLYCCFRSFHAEIARGLDVNGRGVNSVLRRTTFKGMDALHAAAGGKGKLPICRYLVEEAKMDVNKRDTFKGTNY